MGEYTFQGSISEVSTATTAQATLNLPSAPTATLLDDTLAAVEAFRAVKSLVTAWSREVIENQNPFADELILSVHRWIKSTRSRFYDPALQRLLQGLMKKVW